VWGDVRSRWLSRRAVALHVTALVATCGCAVAAWWQVSRAEDGNQLSYFYSVMWPTFGILVIAFWWLLVHTDYELAGRKGLGSQAAASSPGPAADTPAGVGAPASPDAGRPTEVEVDDPDMAAYNARLATLASRGPKTWRHREAVVVRRTR
jgi:hypothetical protein